MIGGAATGIAPALYFFIERDITLTQADAKFDILVNLLLIFLGLFAIAAGGLFVILYQGIERSVRRKIDPLFHELGMSLRVAEGFNYWNTYVAAKRLYDSIHEGERSVSNADMATKEVLEGLLSQAIMATQQGLYGHGRNVHEARMEEIIGVAKNNLAAYLAERRRKGDCDVALALVKELELLVHKHPNHQVSWQATIRDVREKCPSDP